MSFFLCSAIFLYIWNTLPPAPHPPSVVWGLTMKSREEQTKTKYGPVLSELCMCCPDCINYITRNKPFVVGAAVVFKKKRLCLKCFSIVKSDKFCFWCYYDMNVGLEHIQCILRVMLICRFCQQQFRTKVNLVKHIVTHYVWLIYEALSGWGSEIVFLDIIFKP